MPPSLRRLSLMAFAVAMTCGVVSAPAAMAETARLDRALRSGASGLDVRSLQKALRNAGIRVKVDGRYGPGTKRAVGRLQRRLGLRVNGIVDRPFLWSLGLSVCAWTGLPPPSGRYRMSSSGQPSCSVLRPVAVGQARTA